MEEKQNYLVSIIVPVYNTEQYLSKCVDSILNQTYTNLEVVLVDDGSTDDSSKICDRYASSYKRVKVIHKENGGLGSARVTGIEASCGEYIGFVDSDDWIESEMYGSMMDLKKETDEVDIIIGGYLIEKDNKTSYPFSGEKTLVLESKEALIEMFDVKRFNWSLCDKLYKRSLIIETGVSEIWPRNYGEDTFINWILFSNSKRIVYHPTNMYHYVMHEKSMMHQKINRDKFFYFSVYNLIMSDILEKRDYVLQKKVAQVALSVCIPIIFEAQNYYDSYEDDINNGIEQLKSYLELIEDVNNEGDYKKLFRMFSIISRDRKEIENDKSEKKKMLEKLIEEDCIFIYGAGGIAEEILNLLYENKIRVLGLIVSEKKNGMEEINGIKIYSYKEFVDSFESGIVVFAMNENNTQEVLRNNSIGQSYRYVNLGRFSLNY